MAGIFEQYETQQKVQQLHAEHGITKGSVATALFRGLKLEDDSPIFSKQKINFQPPATILELVVSNNRLVLALANHLLIRINLLQPQDLEELDLSKYCANGRIYKVFLDPSGSHLIVSIIGNKKGLKEAQDNLYIPWQNKKIRTISKLKGQIVSSIAWSQRNSSENRTGPFICGTKRGELFELELSSDESYFQSGFELYCKSIFSGFADSDEIAGVEILPCPANDLEYVIMCCSKERLYQFKGVLKSVDSRPFFSELFSHYKGENSNFFEYKGSNSSTFMKLYYQPSTLMASSVAWSNGHGVLHGVINWSKSPVDVLDEVKNMKITRDSGSSQILSHIGTGLVLTPFHLLIPHENEVSVVCIISEKVLMNDRIPSDCGKALGITQDTVKGTVWLYSEKAIFKCKMDREDRNIWNMYLDQNKFELAKKYCHGDQMKLLTVRMREAESLFESGKYVQSANLFAHTTTPFEQVFLKLNSVDADEGLKVYLLEKLSTLEEHEQGQFSLITLVMLEYYFNRLGRVRDGTDQNNQELMRINKEFEEFLNKPKVLSTLEKNSSSVYHLLSSHADKANIIRISLLIKAFDRVVSHLINVNKHMEALHILEENTSEELFLRHLPVLLQVIPVPTIDAMIAKGHKINPLKLMPLLVQAHADGGCTGQIIRYLEYCVNDLDRTDSVLHNFLITIYASYNPDELLRYLKLQGDNIEGVYYDAKIALRECLSAKQEKAAVHILTVMGLYQEAVSLALKFDIELAKATADRQRNDSTLCKKLWLTITKFLVDESQDVEKALSIMKECDLIKIEDVLPFFPDLLTIDLFKEAICESLGEYNKEIEHLKSEMNDASNIADTMRAEIQVLKQQHCALHPQDTCHECSALLLQRPFYLFQCGHKFHQDCLCEAVQECLFHEEKSHYSVLKKKLQALTRNDGKNSWEESKEVKEMLDDLVACECLYCGERTVDSITIPFISDSSWQQVLEEWS